MDNLAENSDRLPVQTEPSEPAPNLEPAPVPPGFPEPKEPVQPESATPAGPAEESQEPAPEPGETPSNEPEADVSGAAKGQAKGKGTGTVDPAILETLAQLSEASLKHRLPAADEERAMGLLKELLFGGRAGITAAYTPLMALPWIVGVNAITAVWPGLSAPMRRHLLVHLAKDSTDSARRLRLSLARALFKLEPAAGLKLAAATAADFKEPETGALSGKSRQTFLNVFIGKGKPWLLQLPLAELKGADADQLVHCAIETFSLCLPISQLSILRWVHQGGRLKKLQPQEMQTVAKVVSRWNAKLQRQLKADVEELPEEVLAVLKPEAHQPAVVAEADAPVADAARPDSRGEPERPAEAEAGERPESRVEQPIEGGTDFEDRTPAGETEEGDSDQAGQMGRGEAPQPYDRPNRGQQRPEHRPREDRRDLPRDDRRDDRGRRPFDFREALRGLEGYVAGLRSDLEQAKTQLRRKEDDFKRSSRPARVEEKPSVNVEALLRHNVQLEETVEQLRQQLEDLASHHEAVAESRLLHTETPLPEGSGEQLKALLAIRLQESYSTFHVMRSEPLDKVFRLDYRDLLGSVFDVLLAEGVRLEQK